MPEIPKSSPDHSRVAELSQLVGGLAHEIKNPLSTVLLNLNLLIEDLARFHDPEHERMLRRLTMAAAEADRVQKVLDDFLRFVRDTKLTLTQIDLREVASELCDFFAPQAQAAGAILRPSFGDEPLPCQIDSSLIKQALLNLLINATQAMPKGGELLVQLSKKGDSAQIEVIDTGRGISPEQRERIFEAYWSSKPGGTGLGLPTARRIAQKHEGDLRVESETDRGSRFTLTLPLSSSV